MVSAIQGFSSRLRVPLIVAALLACPLGSAQAAVVFAESSTDAVINTVVGSEFSTHNFTVSQGGVYRATITDLKLIDPLFFDPSSMLEMQITDVPMTTFSATVGKPGGVDFVDFTASAAGSFAALVKAISGSGGTQFSGYQVRVVLIPEPAVWLMLAAGFGLLGFVRIRRAAQNGM
jgi:PEP-CTERM motif